MSPICTRCLPPLLISFLITSSAGAQVDCQNPDEARWVRDTYGWATSQDVLGLKAIEWYGGPTACLGQVKDTFDGVEFGDLRLDFENGAHFRIETYPPETSVTTLTDSSGFHDGAFVLSILKEYAARIGVHIDWTSPTVEEAEHLRVVTFWDPEDGLNASARMVYSDSVLISIGFSLAL